MPYTVFIDDSGTVGKLFDWDGNAVKIEHPITTVGGLIVDDRFIEEFSSRINLLRDEIRIQLDLGFLPDVHMRLMYGHNLPVKDHGLPNPYLKISPKERLIFVEKSIKIISEFIFAGKAHWLALSLENQKWLEFGTSYYRSDLFKSEYTYIRGLPGGARGLRAYHNVVANPHLDLMARIFFQIDRFVKRRYRDKRVKIIYDANPSSKGLDVLTALKIFRKSGHFQSIVQIGESNRVTPLLQAADVCCYRSFRHSLMAYRKLNDLENSEDLIMNTWAGSYPLRSFSESITNEKKAWIMTIRFEVARTAAISARSDLEPHFCSIEDFSSRCLKALRAKIPEIGISILSQHAKDL